MELVELSPNRRYWVARAGDESKFFDHFYDNQVAAIGHWDKLDLESMVGPIKDLDLDEIKAKLFQIHGVQNQGTAVKDFNQARKFIEDVSLGDIFVTMTSSHIRVGQVTSEPYIDTTLLDSDNTVLSCTYGIRRKVKWSASLYPRSQLPHAVSRSLRGSQTFFSLDAHKGYLNHWMLPCFYDQEFAFFSLKVNQEEDISNVYVADLQASLSKIEAAAMFVNDPTIDLTQIAENPAEIGRVFELYYRQLKLDNKLVLTTQQEFMSPGVIWAKVPKLSSKHMVSLGVMFASVLVPDLSVAGVEEMATTETEVLNAVAQHIVEDNFIAQAVEQLQIEPPKPNKVFKENMDEVPMDDIFPEVVTSENTPL